MNTQTKRKTITETTSYANFRTKSKIIKQNGYIMSQVCLTKEILKNAAVPT